MYAIHAYIYKSVACVCIYFLYIKGNIWILLQFLLHAAQRYILYNNNVCVFVIQSKIHNALSIHKNLFHIHIILAYPCALAMMLCGV